MVIKREKYVRQLAEARGNGMVKIVTGIRRSGISSYEPVRFLPRFAFHRPVVNYRSAITPCHGRTYKICTKIMQNLARSAPK